VDPQWRYARRVSNIALIATVDYQPPWPAAKAWAIQSSDKEERKCMPVSFELHAVHEGFWE
jgi:hypothetical protein